MNEPLRSVLEQIRSWEWDTQESFATLLGALQNPSMTAQTKLIMSRLQLLSHALALAVGNQVLDDDIALERIDTLAENLHTDIETVMDSVTAVSDRLGSVADFAQVAGHSAEKRLDELEKRFFAVEERTTAVCPGCDHPVPVIHMKARCSNCGTEGHLVWNWKAPAANDNPQTKFDERFNG